MILKMGSLILKLVYILVVLSIAADLFNLGSSWLNAKQHGGEISSQSSSQFLPGAHGWIGAVGRAVAVTRSAIKAAKRKAKNQAKTAGRARNKAKNSNGGAGKRYFIILVHNAR